MSASATPDSTPSSLSPETTRKSTFGSTTDGARTLDHRGRDVDRDDAVEALRERGRHTPRAAADLDARPAARVGAEPLEDPLQLAAAPRGIADV